MLLISFCLPSVIRFVVFTVIVVVIVVIQSCCSIFSFIRHIIYFQLTQLSYYVLYSHFGLSNRLPSYLIGILRTENNESVFYAVCSHRIIWNSEWQQQQHKKNYVVFGLFLLFFFFFLTLLIHFVAIWIRHWLIQIRII